MWLCRVFTAVAGGFLTPYPVDEQLDGDQLSGMQGQNRQDGLAPQADHGLRRGVIDEVDRSQQTYAHRGSPLTEARHRGFSAVPATPATVTGHNERSEEVNAMMKISVRKAGAIRLTANCYYCPGCRAG